MKENIQNAIQQALEGSPARKFVESMEISFTLKDVDLKNPANRIQEEVRLPSGRANPSRSQCSQEERCPRRPRCLDWM